MSDVFVFVISENSVDFLMLTHLMSFSVQCLMKRSGDMLQFMSM